MIPLLTLLSLSCEVSTMRLDYRAAAEAWAKKNKLQDPEVSCVGDRGDCSVSWSTTEGRRVAALACEYYDAKVECRAP